MATNLTFCLETSLAWNGSATTHTIIITDSLFGYPVNQALSQLMWHLYITTFSTISFVQVIASVDVLFS